MFSFNVRVHYRGSQATSDSSTRDARTNDGETSYRKTGDEDQFLESLFHAISLLP